MLQESMPSLLASFYGWLTPTVLFLLINLVIGTIAVVSKSSSSSALGNEDAAVYPGRFLTRSFSRTPSAVFDRLRSSNLHRFSSSEIAPPLVSEPAPASHSHQPGAVGDEDATAYPGRFLTRSLSRTPSAVFDRLRSFNLHRFSSSEIAPPLVSAPAPASHRHQPGAVGDEDAAAYPGRFLTRSLSRTPSAVFDRLRSFNLHRFSSSEIAPTLVSAPAPASTEILDPAPPAAATEDERHHHLGRSLSDEHPTAGEMPPKLPERMKKSASEKSAFANFKEEEVEEAEAAAREVVDLIEGEDGEEVDARADDFINWFRHQLKLQRLESIVRYKENLNRGS